MPSGFDMVAIAESLLSTMSGMRLVSTMQPTGEFRIAGSIPHRSILVRHRPADAHQSWELEATLEADSSAGPVPIRTPYRLLASGRRDLHAMALSWLAPEIEWPNGEKRCKVTAKQIRSTDHAGQPWIVALDLSEPLSDEYRGIYRPGSNC